jgi:hypothetical protein
VTLIRKIQAIVFCRIEHFFLAVGWVMNVGCWSQELVADVSCCSPMLVADAGPTIRGEYGSGDIGRFGPSGLRSPEPKHPSGRRVTLVVGPWGLE